MNDPYNQGGRSFRPFPELGASSESQKRAAAKILETASVPLMLVDDIENTGARLAIAALAGQRSTYKGTDK